MKAEQRMPVLASMARFFESGVYGWNFLILFLSSVTTLIVWFNYGQIFDQMSVQEIWQARYAPKTLYQFLLHPVASYGDFAVVLFIMVLTTLILWLFSKISEQVGIGRKTFFLLFILLNFSPEFNQERVAADPYMVSLLLWLVAVWWFIHWYQRQLYIAFLGWALAMWLGGLFSLISVAWALGFPLCFLFWPGRGHHWWKLLADRGRFLLIYYLLVAFFAFVVPSWRNGIFQMLDLFHVKFHEATLEISLLLNSDNNVNLGAGDAFLIAMSLIAFNTLKIASVLIIFVLWLSFGRNANLILAGRVKLFFSFCLGFAWILHALSLLYVGYLQNTRQYLPLLMLLLWLSAGGAYVCVQRLLNGRLRPEHVLVVAWVLVAYALASMLKFGATTYYQREAGEWCVNHPTVGRVWSNSAVALYYAKESPLTERSNLLPFYKVNTADTPLTVNDRYILTQSLYASSPETLTNFEVVATFSNGRNNVSYVLQPKL